MKYLLAVPAAVVAAVLLSVPTAQAVTCPNPVPVVNENNCQGAGSTGWRLTNFDGSRVAGFATSTSVDKGQDVPLKIARSGGAGTVSLTVYRIGYYGGSGGRPVHTASGVPVTGSLSCNATNSVTGHADCNNWSTAYTIPGAVLPASGVYVVRVVDTATGKDNQILFTVRDDNRIPESKILFKLPVATYQAYNHFTGKSFYDSLSSGNATITGGLRAVKLSFDRPFDNVYNMQNWFMDGDYPLIYWLEQQGYDVSYTDNVAVHQNPGELAQHDALVISGHDEYWSREELNGYQAARDAGVDIASFSANTAYWKVRYENGGSTIVDYKTVEGTGGNGALGVNDWGPDGVQGTADDALGLDQRAGTPDDRPENATTTFRDDGAPPGDPGGPTQGRVGPDTPENGLLGSMFIGGHETRYLPLTVPGANAQGEFAGDRIWRRTGISTTSGATIGSKLVSWEWDTIPTQPRYLDVQPNSVKRVSQSETCCDPDNIYLHDEGRVYQSTPPAGQPSTVSAVKYTAASGATVFHAGTIHWSWGLGPHWIDQPYVMTYLDDPVNSSDPRIQQATYNLIGDAGVQPNTPVGITLDGGNSPPVANFSFSPNPAQTGQTVTFDGSASSDPDGSIAKYEWDLDGNGSFETDSGTSATTTKSYGSPQTLSVRLRVTDNDGASGESVNTLTVGSGAGGPYSGAVLGTAGLTHYWRLGETAGQMFADSKGTSHATAVGGTVFGAPGALVSETDKSASFDGADDAASAALNLSATNKLTLEFWLDWSAYADDDDLVLEYTPNFNQQDGGFAVIPNASGTGSRFAVSLGRGTSRNAITFARPSAGQWHHYALVIDTAAPADQQITPYVDGAAIAHSQLASGTGAGNFAASTLYFMSRSASSLFGNGRLDELAIYERALDAATIHDHWAKAGTVNTPPTASFSVSPSSPATGQTVTFDGSASSDPDGSIAKYEWDLDGNGSFETDSGTNATTTKSYGSPQTLSVRLRVTDNDGASGESVNTLTVGSGAGGPYSGAVLGTAGLTHYWRLGETAGQMFADSKGTSHATAVGGTVFGAPGALVSETDRSASFDGADDAASAALNLSATNKLTLEFWLDWSAYADDDDLVLEYTPNFNQQDGGFAVIPNASGTGSRFAVSLGRGTSRNAITFARPSAGQWHHYALVIDTAAPADQQITPYVDGAAIAHSQLASGTGAGNFAASTLYFMSRSASSLFGNGRLDELAIYERALDAATIHDHWAKAGTVNTPPTASFSVSPSSPATGQTVTFDGSASSDPDGSIAKYEWDLDGNGSFETDSGTNATTTKSYSSPQTLSVRLRVTDNNNLAVETSRTLTVQNRPPAAAFTATPSPAATGQAVSFNGTASSDPDGSITKYEWDLDGNGSFETDTGATPTASKAYGSDTTISVRLRVTDDAAVTNVALRTLKVGDGANSPYPEAVLGTSGLLHYWRFGEAVGATLADLAGTSDATLTGGQLGTAGPLGGDPDAAVGFNGSSDYAAAQVDLSASTKITTEFWLRWNAFADDDDLAMELTPDFNQQDGGFAIIPNAGGTSSRFAVSIGRGTSRNSITFARPTAGEWHHYAFVLDSTAPADQQITPYVDGAAVAHSQLVSGTGAGTFARSTLYFMARSGSLFGAGAMDEPAIYQGALTAQQVADHYTRAWNQAPTGSFTATPSSAQTGQTVSFDASASSDDGSITKYEWDLDGNGSFETDSGTAPSASKSYSTVGNVNVGLRVTDNSGLSGQATRTVTITSAYATAVRGTPGLRGYWRLADTDTTARDSSNSNSNGSYLNGPLVFGPLIGIEQDSAHDFDGVDDYVDLSPAALGTPVQVSAEAWVRTDTTKTTNSVHTLVVDSNSDTKDGWLLAINASNRAIFTAVGKTSQSVSATATSAVALAPGTTHHVVGTYDGSTLRTYVDGTLSGSAPFAAGVTYTSSRDLLLGRKKSGPAGSYLNGKLDEAAVYNVALPAATVQSHWNVGRP